MGKRAADAAAVDEQTKTRKTGKTPDAVVPPQEPKAPKETVNKGQASAFLTSVAYHIANEKSKFHGQCKKALEALLLLL